MTAFSDAFAVVVGVEAGFTADTRDSGNWTGGKPGAGVLRGTKYGISAASFPTIDIVNLTLGAASALAKSRYWDPLRLDEVDPRIAFQIFDANYNGGHAVRWMQESAGAEIDGQFGPATLAAVKAADPEKFTLVFDACRLEYMTDCATWQTFSRGWSKRIAANMRRAAA